MNYYAGIDVSLEASCICVIDANGKVIREGKVSSEPTALIAWLSEVGVSLADISSSNPIRWRPRADPEQKHDPGGRSPRCR